MSKGSSATTKTPTSASKAPATSGKSKRKTESSAPAPSAPAPAAAPALAGPPPLIRPELSAIALETSSRVKRQRDHAVVIPQSTSARMAEAARASVWAISSEKTTMQFEAAEMAQERAEDKRSQGLATESTPALDETLRRSSRDLFAFMRDELERPEDEARDPHAMWRRAQKRMRHELSPPPATADLKRLEERVGMTLPTSYWDFSVEWGGGLLYVQEAGAIRIIAALNMVQELKGPLCGKMTRPHLPVVDLGCGDYLAVDMSKETKGGERPVVWWYGGEVKKKVADSFGAWLRKLVEANGQPFWWET